MSLVALIGQGIMGLVGGVTGLFTGEGFVPGFAQGANIIDNAIRMGGYFASGDPGSALGALLGVSQTHLSEVKEGTRSLLGSPLTSIDLRQPGSDDPNEWYDQATKLGERAGMAWLWGKEEWRDTPEKQTALIERVGTDMFSAGITALGIQAIIKLAPSIGGGGLAYFLGNQTGQMTQAIDNAFSIDWKEHNIFGVTGDPNRFGYEGLEEETSEDFIEWLGSYMEVFEAGEDDGET
jgi:hypothetical protein